MKKLALATLFLLLTLVIFADTYAIGTGTDITAYTPFMPNSRYSWSKTLYTVDEINDAGLTSPSLISAVGFFSGNPTEGFTESEQCVYARHIDTENYSEQDRYYPNINQYQLLFQGEVSFLGWGWFYIVFDTPFAWNGNQNIEFLFEDRDHLLNSRNLQFRYTDTVPEYKMVLSINNNHFPNDQQGQMYTKRSNIHLITIPTTPPDAAVRVFPEDEAIYVSLQPALSWAHGGIWPDGYKLNLGTDYPPTDVYNNLDMGNATSFKPSTDLEKNTTYYWQIVPYNTLGDAASCPIWSFSTFPNDFVTIGSITSHNFDYFTPLQFISNNSLSQCLYTQEELGFAHGTITSLNYYYKFFKEVLDVPLQIWMGSTTQDNIGSGFTHPYDMTLVFDGSVDFLAGENAVSITLTTPYLHTSRNLMVLVARTDGQTQPMPYYYLIRSNNTTRGRVLNAWPDEVNPNPYDPPFNELYIARPVTSFSYEVEPVKTDLDCFDLVGTSTPTIGVEESYTVKIRNNGHYTANNYQVMLMQEGGDVLCTVDGPSIDFQQTLPVTLSWIPVATGPVSIYAKVVVAYDDFIENNESNRIRITVQPEDTHVVTIGNSTREGHYPMCFYSRSFLYQGIYYPQELGFQSSFITALKFYSNFASNVIEEEIKIWMLSTDLTLPMDDFLQSTMFTQVFDGTISIPSGESEAVITLDTPYIHTEGNLVIMFYRPYNERKYSLSDMFQTVNGNRGRFYGRHYGDIDPMNPDVTSDCTVDNYPKISIFYSDALENELGCLDLTGNLTPTIGEPCTHTVNIRNNGINPQNNYVVKLYTEGDIEVASVAGPPIAPLQTQLVQLSWTPTALGDVYIYAKMFLDGDEYEDNNESTLLHINVQPEDTKMITIGDGNESSHIPLFFNRIASLYQCLYFEDELGYTEGTITALQLYNNFDTAILNGAVKIWLGNTDLADLSGGYIPVNNMTLVFDGTVNFLAGNNEILIPLTTPYALSPGNLVMMMQHPPEYYQYQDAYNFQCQNSGDSIRVLYNVMFSGSEPLDPDDPPAGWPIDIFPKASFFYSEESVATDLACFGLTGNTSPTVGTANNYIVYIKNNGITIEDNYVVKLYIEGEIEAASVPAPAINPGQTLQLELSWTPSTPGNYYIYAKVELDQDQNEENDSTPNMVVSVNPPGIFSVDVGDGYLEHRIPFNMGFTSSICQIIYYPYDLSGFVGQITGLQLYYNFETTVEDSNIKAWIGTTNQPSLLGGSVPASQLTMVFDGTLDFPAGEGSIMIPFNQPFEYVNGENLVMTLYRWDTAAHPSNNKFKCQLGPIMGHAIHKGYAHEIDPMEPIAGMNIAEFPQTTFFVIPSEVGYINGVVTDTQGRPLANVRLNLDQGLYTALTDIYGVYTLPAPEGTYSVNCIIPRYISQTVENIPIYMNQTTSLNFALEAIVNNPDETTPLVATTLHPNYPNPFNPQTTISYSIKDAGAVRLDIYNIKGQRVTTLVNEDKPSGHYKAIWNGKDTLGTACSSGIYFYCLKAPGYRKINKMLLSK